MSGSGMRERPLSSLCSSDGSSFVCAGSFTKDEELDISII